MATVASIADFAPPENRALLVSCGVHALLIAILFSNVDMFPEQIQPRLAIEATLIDPDSLLTRPAPPAPEPEPVPEPAPESLPEP